MVGKSLRKIYAGWMAFALILGKINTTLLLTLTYILFFPWISLGYKLFGKSSQTAYWQSMDDRCLKIQNLHHPF